MNLPITFDIKNRIFIYNNTYLSDHMPIFCIHNQLKIMSWNINYEDQSVIDLVIPPDEYKSLEGKNTQEFLDYIHDYDEWGINIPPRSLHVSKSKRKLYNRSIKDIRKYNNFDEDTEKFVFEDLLIEQSNIYGCNKRIASCIFLNDTINENNLDIICLQECTSDMHYILQCHFMKEWNIHSFKQFIIMVKKTITATILPSKNEKYMAMNIEYKHFKFKLVNIHITKVADTRVQDIRNIYYNRLNSDVLICGDFNSEKIEDFTTINCGKIFGSIMSDIKCYFLYKNTSPTVLNHKFINHHPFDSIAKYFDYIKLNPVISPSSTSGNPIAPSSSSSSGNPIAPSPVPPSGYTSAPSSAPPPPARYIKHPNHVTVLPGGYYQKYIELKNEYKEIKNIINFI